MLLTFPKFSIGCLDIKQNFPASLVFTLLSSQFHAFSLGECWRTRVTNCLAMDHISSLCGRPDLRLSTEFLHCCRRFILFFKSHILSSFPRLIFVLQSRDLHYIPVGLSGFLRHRITVTFSAQSSDILSSLRWRTS
jgi:hypothetical protein